MRQYLLVGAVMQLMLGMAVPALATELRVPEGCRPKKRGLLALSQLRPRRRGA